MDKKINIIGSTIPGSAQSTIPLKEELEKEVYHYTKSPFNNVNFPDCRSGREKRRNRRRDKRKKS